MSARARHDPHLRATDEGHHHYGIHTTNPSPFSCPLHQLSHQRKKRSEKRYGWAHIYFRSAIGQLSGQWWRNQEWEWQHQELKTFYRPKGANRALYQRLVHNARFLGVESQTTWPMHDSNSTSLGRISRQGSKRLEMYDEGKEVGRVNYLQITTWLLQVQQ